MANAYTLILPNAEGVPRSVVVRLVAMREDGGRLTRGEMEALVKAYPPPAELAAEFANAVAASKPATKSAKPNKPMPTRASPKRR